MRITFDGEADAMYIYFEKVKPGMIKKTISLNEDIIVDFGKNNKILGIEILSATKNLTKKELQTIKATA